MGEIILGGKVSHLNVSNLRLQIQSSSLVVYLQGYLSIAKQMLAAPWSRTEHFQKPPQIRNKPRCANSKELVERGLMNSAMNLNKRHLALADSHVFAMRRSPHMKNSEDMGWRRHCICGLFQADILWTRLRWTVSFCSTNKQKKGPSGSPELMITAIGSRSEMRWKVSHLASYFQRDSHRGHFLYHRLLATAAAGQARCIIKETVAGSRALPQNSSAKVSKPSL